jgi:hypothetical protein
VSKSTVQRWFDRFDVHLIIDNYATHKHSMIKDWLARRPRYHIRYTPMSAIRSAVSA